MNILAALLLVQAVPAQSEAGKFEAAIKKFGDRTYSITEGGKPGGKLTLKTRVEAEDGGKAAVFEDHLIQSEARLTSTERASLEGFTLIRGTRTGTFFGEDIDWTVRINKDDALLSAAGRFILRDARGALGEQAVLRRVCAQEQRIGATFRINVIVLDPVGLDERRAFECVAKEEVEFGGGRREAFKWREKWKGERIKAGESVAALVDSTYWVSPEGYLLRFTIGTADMTLDVPIQASPPQSEADKLEAALKKFGDRNYRIFTMGKETGRVSLKTRIETEADQKLAVFEDKIVDEVERGTMTEKIALVGPRLLSITSKDIGGKSEVAIYIREGKATIKMGEETKSLNVTKFSGGMGSLFRMVCMKEQKVGAPSRSISWAPMAFQRTTNSVAWHGRTSRSAE